MKQLNLKVIIPIILLAVLQSCAFHGGYMSNSASLSSNNFQYVKNNAQGTAMATYVFGLGGNEKMALVNEAKMDLLEKNRLKPNQTLVNITVNFIVTIVLATIVAAIIVSVVIAIIVIEIRFIAD
jgi:hypothetical protein